MCNKKLALNNLHQAGPSKPIYDDAWKYKNQIRKCIVCEIWDSHRSVTEDSSLNGLLLSADWTIVMTRQRILVFSS